MALNIIDQKQTTKFSKIFTVAPGRVVVISSFNFRCAETNDTGEIIRQNDCAVLHRIEVEGDPIPSTDGCVGCNSCVLSSLSAEITRSEPVVHCGDLWVHTPENNISVLSVPGYYMFELCDASAIGTVIMQVEELTVEQAQLIPRPLFHGE